MAKHGKGLAEKLNGPRRTTRRIVRSLNKAVGGKARTPEAVRLASRRGAPTATLAELNEACAAGAGLTDDPALSARLLEAARVFADAEALENESPAPPSE